MHSLHHACTVCLYSYSLIIFIELQKANNSYQEKLIANRAADQAMFGLTWDIEELKNIDSDLAWCIDFCNHESFQVKNVPEKITNIRATLSGLIKRTSHFRRTPATHVFVLMVSSETCDKKPYALPVQCVPYCGLKESDLRSLVNNLCKEMKQLGLKPSGN